MPDRQPLLDKIEEAISLADVQVTYDSIGRRYTHIANTRKIAECVLSIVRRASIGELARA